jgi:TatD DNase family protein
LKQLDPGKLRSTTREPLIDSHIHLDSTAYASDWEAVAERARLLGVYAMVLPATNLQSSVRIGQLASQDPTVYATAGIHPHDAASFDGQASVEALQQLLQSNKCVAIGETGLESHYDFCPLEQQQQSLRAHLELAREVKLPLILHCRSAEAELYEELKRIGPFSAGGVVHCFTGAWEWGQRFLELGFHIGIGGLSTLANAAEVHKAARLCPIDRLLLETDGPYLTPRPFRGMRNESGTIPIIAEEVARLREQNVDEIAHATTRNSQRLFGLRPIKGVKSPEAGIDASS